MNILFIAFEFAPLNRGGIYRPLAFCKYLPDFGIQPILLTLAESSLEKVYGTYKIDDTLRKKIPLETKIIQVPTSGHNQYQGIKKFIYIYFSIHGNETNHWKKEFFQKSNDLISQYQPKVIVATIPPFSVLPIVHEFAKKNKLPLVLDFRDAWSQWRAVPYGTIFHYWLTLWFEKKYLKSAYAVITTSEQTLSDFKKHHSSIPVDKFHCILNGYEGKLGVWNDLNVEKDQITIGYVGSFYYNPEARSQMLKPWWKKRGHRMLQYVPHQQDWLYRSPYFFFKTIVLLGIKYPSVYNKIKIKLAGRQETWLSDMIHEFGLDEMVEHLGHLSHDQSLQFQRTCDLLLITSAKQLDGSSDYSIAGKTYEYFQMMRPILAFVCKGAQKDILIKAGSALICDPDEIESSAQLLFKICQGDIKLRPNLSFLNSLSRSALSKRLADIIHNINVNEKD